MGEKELEIQYKRAYSYPHNYTIRLDDELLDSITVLKNEYQVDMSDFLRKVIREGVKKALKHFADAEVA